MSRKLFAGLASLALTASAFAAVSDTAYKLTLPGETVIYSTNFTGISVADWSTQAAPDANVGAAGYWTTNGIGVSDGSQLVLVQGAITGTNKEPKATYKLDSTINVKDGPVTLYWKMKSAVATTGDDLYMAGGISLADATGAGSVNGLGTWREPNQHKVAVQFWEGNGMAYGGTTAAAWAAGGSGTNAGNGYGSGVIGFDDGLVPPMDPRGFMDGAWHDYKLVATPSKDDTLKIQAFSSFVRNGLTSWAPIGAPTQSAYKTGFDTNGDTFIDRNGELNDVWFFASPWVGGGAYVDDVVVTQGKAGDTDMDGDIDGDDYFNIVTGFGNVAPVGNLTDTTANPDLVYDAATGNVKLDLTERTIDTYQIKAPFTTLANMPIWESYEAGGLITKTLTELFESNPTGALTANLMGVKIFDLGNILAPNLTQAQLWTILGEARWAKGTTLNGKFDLTGSFAAIPEPASLGLLALAGILGLRRRAA